MILESPAPQNAPGGSSSIQAALHSQTEFLWQALKETANLLMKAIAFYLAITAANPKLCSYASPPFCTSNCRCLDSYYRDIAIHNSRWSRKLGTVDRSERFAACPREVIARFLRSIKDEPILHSRPHCFLDHNYQYFTNRHSFVGRYRLLATPIIDTRTRFG